MNTHSSEQGASSTSVAQEGSLPSEAAAEPSQLAAPVGTTRRRRSWKRWLANLLIIAGVLVLAYPVGTWAYTWWEQRQLRGQLEQEHPGIAKTSFAGDFVSVNVRGTNAGELSAAAANASASAAEQAAAEAALAEALAAERERLAQLAAFESAADAFEAWIDARPGEPIGKILIPSIGVDVIMLEGANTRDLREGPGHWPETPFPGQGGNFVLSGHRTTYGAPFRKLDKVEPGDLIELVLPYAVARYEVSRVIIVQPDQVEEVAQLGREQVSLAACHPMYSASQRIVVQGELISFKLIDT